MIILLYDFQRHEIPISAIPCLAYRRALEEEEKQKEIDRQIQEQIKNGTWKQNIVVNDDTQKSDNNTQKSSDNNEISNDNSEKSNDNTEKSNDNTQISNDNTQKANDNTNELNECAQDSTENNETNIHSSKKSDQIDIEIIPSKCPFNHLAGTQETQISDVNGTNEKSPSPSFNQTNNEDCRVKLNAETTENHQEESADQSKIDFETTMTELPLNRQPVILPGGIVMPPPRVETVSASWKTQHLTHEQVNDYCKILFKFKTVNIMHFK